MEPSCFSIPEPVFSPRTALGARASRWAWARALPVHTALAVGGGIALVVACTSRDGALAVVAALAVAIAARARRAVGQVTTDTPLAVALVGPRSARVLSLRASSGGWTPMVLDARVLTRRGLDPSGRALGYLLRYRGGYGFVPLTALASSRARTLAMPAPKHEPHFRLLERLVLDPRLTTLTREGVRALGTTESDVCG